MSSELNQQFHQHWLQHSSAIARVAASYEHNPAKREELVQEIALACWRSYANCNDLMAIKGFFLRIAHNKSVDHITKQVKEPKNTEQVAEIPSVQCDFSAIEKQQQQQKMLNAMQQLTIEQKQVVGLLLEGMSYQQIAEITGLSNSNVGVLINRGKKRLQELLNAK